MSFPGFRVTRPRRSLPMYRQPREVLEKLHKSSGISDFYELYKVLGNAKKQGLS